MEYEAAHLGGLAANQRVQQQAVRSDSPLSEAANRIQQITDALYEMATRLHMHADTVFGPPPPTDPATSASAKGEHITAAYGGQLGELFGAISRLEGSAHAIAFAGDRNALV